MLACDVEIEVPQGPLETKSTVFEQTRTFEIMEMVIPAECCNGKTVSLENLVEYATDNRLSCVVSKPPEEMLSMDLHSKALREYILPPSND